MKSHEFISAFILHFENKHPDTLVTHMHTPVVAAATVVKVVVRMAHLFSWLCQSVSQCEYGQNKDKKRK